MIVAEMEVATSHHEAPVLAGLVEHMLIEDLCAAYDSSGVGEKTLITYCSKRGQC